MLILRFTLCLWIDSIAHTRNRVRAEKIAPYNLVAPKCVAVCVYVSACTNAFQVMNRTHPYRRHSHTDTDKRARRLCHFLW